MIFVSHLRFLLYVSSMWRRHKALTLANVYADKCCHLLTKEQLVENVRANNWETINHLQAFGAQIPGTPSYFQFERSKSNAFEKCLRIDSNGEVALNAFMTFSVADLHWPDLHRLLPGHEKYMDKTVVKHMRDIPADANQEEYITEAEDNRLRREAVSDNGNVVDEFVHQKFKLFLNEILVQELGVTDYIVRFEFQNRGTVHMHMAAHIVGISQSTIELAAKKYKFDVVTTEPMHTDSQHEEIEDLTEVERQRLRNIRAGFPADDIEETDELKESVRQAREEVVKFACHKIGLSANHCTTETIRWPGPEGHDVQAPVNNVLRKQFTLHETADDRQKKYEQQINRVQLHKCSKVYCLVYNKKENTWDCRFKFPHLIEGWNYNFVEGSAAVMENFSRNQKCQHGGEISEGDLILMRNHPRLVGHNPEVLHIWQANTDAQMIKNLKTALRYIMKYIMKNEKNSEAYNDVIRKILDNAGDDVDVKKLCQRILLKALQSHDIR